MVKRAFDIVFSTLGLLLLAPIFLVVALAILIDDGAPVLFRQVRVGRRGKAFRIIKFRTMRKGAESGGPLTISDDPRVTAVGRRLRRWKLDELPQLVNVLIGDMSLVGPRPELPRYIKLYSPEDRELILSVRPGVTDIASIEFRDENDLLTSAGSAENRYVEEILPQKLALNRAYLENAGLWVDLKLIFKTLRILGQ